LVHFLANDDHKDTLSLVEIFAESRKTKFTVERPGEHPLFEHFPEELLDALANEEISLHAHSWAVKTDTYKERPQLDDFFNVLAVDEHEGQEFVVAVEGKHYPVTGIMFHPETQSRKGFFVNGVPDGSITGKVNTETTDAIQFYFSKHVRD